MISLEGVIFSLLLFNPNEHLCYTKALYYEARGEPLEGQYLVLDTIRNRQNSGRSVETCRAVTEKPKQFSKCISIQECHTGYGKAFIVSHWNAFSWHMGRSEGGAACNKCMYFHSGQKPDWDFRRLVFVTKIGGHYFYRNAF